MSLSTDLDHADLFVALYEGDEYSLKMMPDASSPLVLASRKEVLRNMNLERLGREVDLASDLLLVAFFALEGTDLSRPVLDIRYGLKDLITEAEDTMEDIKVRTQNVQKSLVQTFMMLLNFQENIALRFLVRCAAEAEAMSTAAAQLSAGFRALSDSSQKTAGDALVQESRQYEKKAELEKERAEYAARTANYQEMKKQLQAQEVFYEAKYQEFKAEQETEDQRAFILGMTKTVVDGVAKGIGAFAAMRTPKLDLNLGAAPANKAAGPQGPGGTAEASPPLRATPEPPPNAGSGLPTKEQAEKLQTIMEETGDDIAQLRDSASVTAKSAREARSQMLNFLIKAKQAEAEAAAAIEEYAVRMQNLEIEQGNALVAAELLHQAVASLNSAALLLDDVNRFWNLMAIACKRLAEDKVADDIELYMAIPKETRAGFYAEPIFKDSVLSLYGGWKALEVIALEYETSFRVQAAITENDMNRYPSVEEAHKMVKELARALLAESQRITASIEAEAQAAQSELQLLTAGSS